MTFVAAFNVNYGQMYSGRSRLQVELKAKANSGFFFFFFFLNGRNHSQRLIFRNWCMFACMGLRFVCIFMRGGLCV